MRDICFVSFLVCATVIAGASAAEPQSARHSLFNGRDLAGWVGVGGRAEDCWQVEGDVLTCIPKKGAWLRSDKQYDDFNLQFDYRVQPGANSGIYVRVPADGNHHRDSSQLPKAGFEVQLLDDAAEKYANLMDYQYSGSVYDIAGATRHVCRPAGQWNSLEIDCRGDHVKIVHNGVPIVDADAQRYPMLALRERSGYLGLQNHGGGVSFRNITIGPANK